MSTVLPWLSKIRGVGLSTGVLAPAKTPDKTLDANFDLMFAYKGNTKSQTDFPGRVIQNISTVKFRNKIYVPVAGLFCLRYLALEVPW